MRKDTIDYFNSVLTAIKGIGLIAFAMLTLLYFLSPSMEKFVRDKVLNDSRHFYVGKWDLNSKKYVEKSYEVYQADFDSESGLITPGNVVLAVNSPVVGRTKYGTSDGMVAYVGRSGDCLYVLDSVSRDMTEPGYKAIWIRALPQSCK